MADTATVRRPPPYPYRSRSASVSLPSYRAEKRDGEQTLVSQPVDARFSLNRYTYASPSMTLDLGQRQARADMPAYGNNATVQGTLRVKDLKDVTRISCTVSGKATYTIFECGCPILQQSKTVLHHSTPLWSSTNSQRPRHAPTTFPVSFPLPTYARWSSSLLPPSARFAQGNFKLAVTYQLVVSLTRTGRLKRDEQIEAEFAYAPRSIPDAGPIASDTCVVEAEEPTVLEEDKPCGVVRWKAANLQADSTSEGQASVVLHLPFPTSYPSGPTIPFRIIIPSLPTTVNLNRLKSSDNTSIELVKQISIRLGKTPMTMERVVGHGVARNARLSGDGRTVEIVGGIEGLGQGGETSWGLGSFAECSYIVRTTVNLPLPTSASGSRPSRPSLASSSRSSFSRLSLVRSSSSYTSSSSKSQMSVTYHHDEPIHLCTDAVEAFEIEADDAWERPAIGLLPKPGDSRPFAQRSLTSKGRQLLQRAWSGLASV